MRKVRSDHGTYPSVTIKISEEITKLYTQNPNWSYQLLYDNLKVLHKQFNFQGALPSYSVVHRYMKSRGLFKKKTSRNARTDGMIAADRRFEAREVRSYEVENPNGLWHLDFHKGSLRILLPNGTWVYASAMGIMDDYSRLCLQIQWYFYETAANLSHSLWQAIFKYGLPCALMTDNGGPMTADEIIQGLKRLAIKHETTLPYSPYQNGKQENFWSAVEGRLLNMLQNVKDLTLEQLNEYTAAWCVSDYNEKIHSEIGMAPIQRYVQGKLVGNPSPSMEELRLAFTAHTTRKQRKSDGTISLYNKRFEIPSRYRHLTTIDLRVASWDLSYVHMADPRTQEILCRIMPLDKVKNSNKIRRAKPSLTEGQQTHLAKNDGKPAPLLQSIIKQHRDSGVPPSYITKEEDYPDKANPNKSN